MFFGSTRTFWSWVLVSVQGYRIAVSVMVWLVLDLALVPSFLSRYEGNFDRVFVGSKGAKVMAPGVGFLPIRPHKRVNIHPLIFFSF